MVWPILNEHQNAALRELLLTPSDRIAGILGGAMLDNSLRLILENRLRVSKIKEKIFKINGPMGNLGPKIELAYLLYIFEKDAWKTMTALAEIRNMCAHNMIMSFEDQNEKTTRMFDGLCLHQGKTHYPSPFSSNDTNLEIEDISTRRGLWTVNLKLSLTILMKDLGSHCAWSNIPLGYGQLPSATPEELAQLRAAITSNQLPDSKS